MPKAEASEEKLTGTRTKLSLHEPTPRRQIVLAQASLTCLEAYMEACQTPGFEGEMYWHGHDLEALRSSSRLAQEQASERKPIGTSTILRRFGDRRGWPQEQASEGKRTGSGTISRHFEARQACRRTGLGRKTYWQEHDRDARRGSSRLAQEQAS